MTHEGEYIEVTLGRTHMTKVLEEQNTQDSKPVNNSGTVKSKDNEAPLTPEEHTKHTVGKSQWRTYEARHLLCDKGTG